MERIKYSILIPAYNVQNYIQRSINSALNQKTKYNYEIIVCDDGSSDNTLNVINKYSDKIKIIKNEINKKGIITRNKLVNESKGEYIIWLDSDDELSNKTLTVLDEKLNNNKEYDILAFTTKFIYPNNKEGGCTLRGNKIIYDDNMLDIFFSQKVKWFLHGKAIRREIMVKSLPPDMNLCLDDVFFALKIYYYAKSYCECGSAPLYNYYYGIGFWSTEEFQNKPIDFKRFKDLCLMRSKQFYYNKEFLESVGLYNKYASSFIQSCNITSLFYELIKVNDYKERVNSLSQLFKCLKIQMSINKYE